MPDYQLPLRKKRLFLSEKFCPLNKTHVIELIKRLFTEIPTDFSTASNWYGLFQEASIAISEQQTKLELDFSLDIRNKHAEKKLVQFEEDILSEILNVRKELMQIYLSSPWKYSMHPYDNNRVTLDFNNRQRYTDKNMSYLQIEENQLIREYKKFLANAKTDFQGSKVLVSIVSGKLNDNDKNIRKEAFLSYWEFVRQHEDIYQNLFDKILDNRRNQARLAHAESYVKVAFAELGRIDYSEIDCATFRKSICEEVVPVVSLIAEKQKNSLGTSVLLPWDQSFYPDFVPNELSFKGNTREFQKRIKKIISNIHPSFALLFEEMEKRHLLDLAPRVGKAPGAYCVSFQESGMPFIFANFNVSYKDALTFIHEFGHAIHSNAMSCISNILLRQPGFEFCEFASMGLELLGNQFFNELWEAPKDVKKAQINHIFNMLQFWPFMAMIDEWQHTIYSSKEKLDKYQRNKAWLEISRKYKPHINWEGYEQYEELGWLSRPHIFSSPFYYIDYGIAQLGAMQLWKKSKVNYKETVELYIKSLSLGGQVSLPELFKVAGLNFNFDSELLRTLILDIVNFVEN